MHETSLFFKYGENGTFNQNTSEQMSFFTLLYIFTAFIPRRCFSFDKILLLSLYFLVNLLHGVLKLGNIYHEYNTTKMIMIYTKVKAGLYTQYQLIDRTIYFNVHCTWWIVLVFFVIFVNTFPFKFVIILSRDIIYILSKKKLTTV